MDKVVANYEIGIEHGYVEFMLELGAYYRDLDTSEMEKYYKMGIELGDYDCLLEYLGYFSENNKKLEDDFIFNLNYDMVNKKDGYGDINNIINFIKKEMIFFTPNGLIKEIYNKNNLILPDFKIITKNEIYDVHKFVLDSRYFINLFSGKFIKTNEISMNIENEKTIENLIEYLYLGTIDWDNMSDEILDEFEQICDEYEFMNALKSVKFAKLIKKL